MGDLHTMRASLRAADTSPPKPTMTLIYAGDLQRATVIAKARGLEPGQWRYARDEATLRGYSGPKVLVLLADSWYDRGNERGRILTRIKLTQMTSEYVRGY
jgi:hypothetical protein